MKQKAARAKRRMQELTFGTFNVRTVAFKGVNGIGHIDVLLRICAAKGCDVISLQETKRDGISEIVAAGKSAEIAPGSEGDCTGVRGKKGQHGVGLAIKQEIVKKNVRTVCPSRINKRDSLR